MLTESQIYIAQEHLSERLGSQHMFMLEVLNSVQPAMLNKSISNKSKHYQIQGR